MANGTIKNTYPSDIFFGAYSDIKTVTVDGSTAGDFYADTDMNLFNKAGYECMFLYAYFKTYRAYVKGVGSDRIYYTIETPAQGNMTMNVIPVYRKL